jgi:atypical dual specificity phosphatase
MPESDLIWWMIPGVIGGMPMPYLHLDRREALGGPADAWNDEIAELHREGVGAVVCLLNIPSDDAVYRSAGFDFLLMPVRDGGIPTPEQIAGFFKFMEKQRSTDRSVAVHCAAGLGRTGTVVAAWLIYTGMKPQEAIAAVRKRRPGAIETHAQELFLNDLPALLNEMRF